MEHKPTPIYPTPSVGPRSTGGGAVMTKKLQPRWEFSEAKGVSLTSNRDHGRELGSVICILSTTAAVLADLDSPCLGDSEHLC